MKRLIQIFLIAILVLVLFQAAASGSVTSSSQIDLGAGSNRSSAANTTLDDAHASICLITIKNVPCIRPNVGWNS